MVDKIANPAAAANAYSVTAKSSVPGIGGDKSESSGVSFGEMLETAARNAIETVRGGEKASAQAVAGNASLVEVTQAVTQARLALDTVVAVRDQMIEAYNRIIAMPI